jgi:hypothetical protein
MPRKSKNADLSKLDALTGEEIDALRVDLVQDADDIHDPDDGTGLIGDDVARDRIESLTESGPDSGDRGVLNESPGRDDTSDILRKHRLNTDDARAWEEMEDNLDEPRDELISDRDVDEGTAA